MADLVGRTFGLLTVVERVGMAGAGSRRRGQIVRCICACGGAWTGLAASLTCGNTKACGCISTGNRPNPDRELVAINRLRRNYVRHARRRGLPWALTESDFRRLIKEDCFYCSSPPETISRNKAYGARKTESTVVYNGIDRQRNAEGYTLQNVVPCCRLCNFAKRDLSVESFLSLVNRVFATHWSQQ
jgi:hypothetical protein